MSDAAIAVEHLHKRYGDIVAVEDISFRVERATIFGLLGRNGAGKTTTLESCVGLVRPTSGRVRVLGLDPTNRGQLAALRRRFGVQLQATSLPEKANVRELLEVYAAYYGIRADPEASADRVGLEGKLDRLVGRMSGGEKQRLALALALQHDPEIVFLDEPSAGMDAYGRRVLWAEVDRLRDAGKTIVLTTHYIEEAERLCDRVCVVQRGRVIAEQTPQELIERYGGGASITFTATAFTLSAALAAAGVWTRDDDRWSVVTDREPGRLLGEIVAHANAGDVIINALDLHRPGLEDAFLALTGERIEESRDEEPAA
jgi:ABC-2 type transport system ATP-binding protein